MERRVWETGSFENRTAVSEAMFKIVLAADQTVSGKTNSECPGENQIASPATVAATF
jgi:hypothetical protein